MEQILIIIFSVGLIFPRLTLLVAYILGEIPPNEVPFFWDVVGAVVAPRILLIIYLAMNADSMDYFYAWLITHISFLFIEVGAKVLKNLNK